MTNKELFYFTGKCLTLDEHPAFGKEIIENCRAEQIDWEEFVHLCSSHLILPAIYLQFRNHHILEHIPEELSQHLKDIHELNVKRNNLILDQLQHITEVLNRNNIYPVFMKGSGNLLDGLYADIGERILGDIDFLVPEKDYLLSGELFEDEGYTRIIPVAEYYEISEMKHYPRLSHPRFVASIEIHRLPVSKNYLRKYNSEIIDQEKKTVNSLEGCYVLSDSHKIIHNFIHSQLSNRGHAYGIVSFRDIYDLYLMSKRIEIKDTLPRIENKQKAIAYFVFAGEVFGLSGKFYPRFNFPARLLLKKHSLNLSSRVFYRLHRAVVYIIWQIFVIYLGQIRTAFHSKRMRQSIAQRLGNPSWYKSYVDFHSGFFTNKHD
jgi:hypothetical protein